MLKTIYLFLALFAAGATFWQMGFVIGLPGSPEKPDLTITLTALSASSIFFGLWLANVIHRERKNDRMFT